MPGVTDQDFEAANLMMKVLDDELGLEIRTKRSLSYAVFSYMINYSRGIGMIGVSTSKTKRDFGSNQSSDSENQGTSL